MAEDKSSQAIIIKKVNKGGGAHHGGAWKIAYADFVTAMMAFFLLLWLLNSISQEQLEGISNYFAPVSVSSTSSGGGDILGGATIAVKGSAQTSTSRDSVTVELPPPKAGTGGEGEAGSEEENPPTEEEALEEKMRQKEEEDFEKAKKELEEKIAEVPELNELADSLLIDNTPEGLRIQLVDKDGLSMFPSGSAVMHAHTQRILSLVSKVIAKMPQQISVSGHTDSVAFVTDNGYSNWELSADRANAARRALVDGAVPFERVSRVTGKAATDPFLPDDTKNAKNRRLSIIMLRGTGKDNPANIEEMRKKREEKKKKKEKTKKKKAGEDETLPGLEAIRKRQSIEGPEKVKEKPPAPVKDPFAKAKAQPKKPEKLKLEPEEDAAPVLPGLEGIRQRQIREGLKKEAPAQKAPDTNLKELEKKKGPESIQPIIRLKETIERTEGEALPGLGAIRKRQLEQQTPK
ncbi:MAG: flagellar motor protein MotB [Proteobacteria bacterium]|nr:flagellar motor protein MotB [Pseudomonadota bacterium]MDA1024154.1 flagellar motor protein MotB [Pseudomonadota bacterium]